MGFNRRKSEDQRRQAAEREAAARRATDAQVLEDAERLIAVWNERQAKRMPMLFSPTIAAAITAGYWFLWVRCPACPGLRLWLWDRLRLRPDLWLWLWGRLWLPLPGLRLWDRLQLPGLRGLQVRLSPRCPTPHLCRRCWCPA
jgi:hypothetical protein